MEKKAEKASIVMHTIAGIAMGYASIFVGNNRLAVCYGIALLFIVGYILQATIGRKGLNWWVSNGMLAYLLIWFASWIFFYNIKVV
ncbi:MAG TPA: hypothetical protein ENG42_00920 [Candidatus Aenigmarchaeota archaeon]|nr:MAG: hypothetical protein DRP03_01205 [Candidatus Aenigmarchaeota archaeon]HDD46012.1 hypothetical protein [Candidatus Aenigmarchaeota archaeon]